MFLLILGSGPVDMRGITTIEGGLLDTFLKLLYIFRGLFDVILYNPLDNILGISVCDVISIIVWCI